MRAQSSVSPDLLFRRPCGISVPKHLDGEASVYLVRSILVGWIPVRYICCRTLHANIHHAIRSLAQLRFPVHSVNLLQVLVVAFVFDHVQRSDGFELQWK